MQVLSILRAKVLPNLAHCPGVPNLPGPGLLGPNFYLGHTRGQSGFRSKFKFWLSQRAFIWSRECLTSHILIEQTMLDWWHIHSLHWGSWPYEIATTRQASTSCHEEHISTLLYNIFLVGQLTRNTDSNQEVRKVLRITCAFPCHKLFRINILTVWNLNLVVWWVWWVW